MDILLDPIMDSVKALPVLFIAFLVVEILKNKNIANRVLAHTRLGPPVGALLGTIPQCGFSVVAAQLYGMRVVTMGTLIAIFMATSDEAIPILLVHPHLFGMMLLLIAAKFVVGAVTGVIVDAIHHEEDDSYEYIEIESCSCGTGVDLWINVFFQTLKIFFFILLTNIVMTLLIAWVGEETLSTVLKQNIFLQPLLAGLVGFIPNCAGSVILTQLYVTNALSFGALFTGLTTSAGVGTIALFAYHKNVKKNIAVLCISYIVSTLVGYILIIAL